MSTDPILEVSNLLVGYKRGMPLISIPHLSAVPGRVVGVCGANGSGKSTFIKALVGLVPYVKGTLLVYGKKIPRLRPEIIAKRIRVGYLPQHSRVFANLSVGENILIASRGKNQREKIEILLSYPKFKLLHDLWTAPARSLSGGEALLLGLACMEAFDPDLFLLDEPTAGADQALRSLLIDSILRWSARGKGVVLVEQDHSVILTVAASCYGLVPVSADSRDSGWQSPYVVLPIPTEQFARIKSEKAAGGLMDAIRQISKDLMLNPLKKDKVRKGGRRAYGCHSSDV